MNRPDKPPRSPAASTEAARVFQGLLTALESGGADPEALFSSHPGLEPELRVLYDGWRHVDSLFRDLATASALGSVLDGLDESTSAEERALLLQRLEHSGRFAERYELGEELGRGGMGIVRRVHDRLLGRDVALKVVRERDGDAQRLRLLRRFLAEAEVTGRLQHPAIPPIHDLGLDDHGHVYFTMPLIEGATLEEVLARARDGDPAWTLARVLEVLIKVADALAYAHSQGVLHRDLKPANVLVGRFGEAYVLDWGLARSTNGLAPDPETGFAELRPEGKSDLTLAGEVIGTLAYVAPEQVERRQSSTRGDVYSFGAVLYEALSGQRPYSSGEREPSARDTLRRLLAGPPASIDEIAPRAPRALRSVVRKSMQREPAERYASLAEVSADLRAFLDGKVVTAHESGRWAELRAWTVRNRRPVVAAALVGVVALVGGLLSLQLHARNVRLESEARRIGLRDSRAALCSGLVRLRTASALAGPDLVEWVRPEQVEQPLPQGVTLREDVDRWLLDYEGALVDAIGTSLARGLEALYAEASTAEREALLDELYGYEQRLVLTQGPRASRGSTPRLLEIDQVLSTWEGRELPRRLRGAWFAHLAGDGHAFEPFLNEGQLQRASASDLVRLGTILMTTGRTDEARPVLQRANALDPGLFAVHFFLATLTQGSDRLMHAHAATVLDPSSARALYNHAWNFQNIPEAPFGDPARAEEPYRRALELDPGLWEAALNLTYLVEPEEAVELMERSIERSPRAILYLRLAERFRALRDPEHGIAACERGLEHYPDDASLWAMLGEWFGWTSRWSEAADALERAIELDPGQATAYNNLCVALASLSAGETDPHRVAELDRRNLEVARKAYARFPERADIVEKLGIAHWNLDEKAVGARFLLDSIGLGNESARGYLNSMRTELASDAANTSLVEEIDAALGR